MKKRTKLGDEFSKSVVHIMYINSLIMSTGDKISAVGGQSSARWRILAVLDSGEKTVAEMARLLGNARQSVQRIADDLYEEDLIDYKDNPNDKRSEIAELTKKGRKALELIQIEQVSWANKMGERFSEKKLIELNSSLEALSKVFEEFSVNLQ